MWDKEKRMDRINRIINSKNCFTEYINSKNCFTEYIRSWIFLFCLFLLAHPAGAEQDYGVGRKPEFYSYPTYTQIVLEKAEKTGYVHVISKSSSHPRLFINLFPAVLLPFQGKEVKVGDKYEFKVEDRFVQGVYLEQELDSVVKVVLDLVSPNYTYNIFLEDPRRLVIEVRGKDLIVELLKEGTPSSSSLFAAQVREEEGTEEKAYEEDAISSLLLRQREEEKVYKKVVLDPGHGGKDPGAIGPSGLKEKDVVLAVAKELAKLLEEEPGVKVYLTRRDDSFISLNQRTGIANQIGGDIFISIHANAGYSKEASGVETFFNSRYSYGEGAEAVAARENVSLGSEDVSEEAKAIFWDLIQDRYRNESNDLSHLVQGELSETTDLENRGVKSAPFYVLRGAAMPAILVEIGFISNPWEERKLKGEDFRKRIALGIFKGLKAYLE